MAELELGPTGPPDAGGRLYVGVAQQILAAIGAGRLSPGDRLPNERELARLCAASRPTVRDALLALELFGVVEVRRGSGCYVTEHGAENRAIAPNMLDSVPRDLLEARLHVEPVVSRLCAARVESADIVALGRLIDECEATEPQAADGDLEPFLLLSHRFHAEFAARCGNRILIDLTQRMVDVAAHPLWMVVNGMHVRTPAARQGQILEHRAVLEAVARGDGDGAATAMRAHLEGLFSAIFGRAAQLAPDAIVRQRPRSR